MASRQQFKMSVSQRRRRFFSEAFKKQKVREIECGLVKVSELCENMRSQMFPLYKWINKFGKDTKNKPERLIMESKSDTKNYSLLTIT